MNSTPELHIQTSGSRHRAGHTGRALPDQASPTQPAAGLHALSKQPPTPKQPTPPGQPAAQAEPAFLAATSGVGVTSISGTGDAASRGSAANPALGNSTARLPANAPHTINGVSFWHCHMFGLFSTASLACTSLSLAPFPPSPLSIPSREYIWRSCGGDWETVRTVCRRDRAG